MTEEEYLTLNLDYNKINKMSVEEKKVYFKEYETYMNFFLKYLLEKTDIKKYDDLIFKDSHKFLNIETEVMDIYQKFSNGFLKYFYIRNNLHIERLNDEEKKYLDTKIKNNDYSYDSESYNFIEQTFKKLIYEVINENPEITGYINYGPFSEQYIALNDSLVIGFRYDEFNENGFSDEEWDKNYYEQKMILEELLKELEESIRKKMDLNCKIICYDEFSVILPNKTKINNI